MRPIDGDKIGLNDIEIVMCEGSYKKALEMLIDKINNAPTVDAVPVVRCKDCKYWNAFASSYYQKRGNFLGYCKLFYIKFPWYQDKFETGSDDFCSKGERKETDNEND